MKSLRLALLFAWIGWQSAPSASASTLWEADFEKSNLSEWDSFVVHPERWTFPSTTSSSDPAARSGQHCAKVELHSGDTYGAALRSEVEFSAPLAGFEGSDRYYAWSVHLSADAPFLPTDHEVVFFESTGGSVYHQMMGLHVNTATVPPSVSFSTSPQNAAWSEAWKSKMSASNWHDFVLHVKWSLDPAVGFIELWFDGTLVVSKTMMRTMVSNNGPTAMTGGLVTALHAGILSSSAPANKPIEVIYLDRFRSGAMLSDVVDPPAGGGPDAGPTSDARPDAGPDAGNALSATSTSGGCSSTQPCASLLALLVVAVCSRPRQRRQL